MPIKKWGFLMPNSKIISDFSAGGLLKKLGQVGVLNIQEVKNFTD